MLGFTAKLAKWHTPQKLRSMIFNGNLQRNSMQRTVRLAASSGSHWSDPARSMVTSTLSRKDDDGDGVGKNLDLNIESSSIDPKTGMVAAAAVTGASAIATGMRTSRKRSETATKTAQGVEHSSSNSASPTDPAVSPLWEEQRKTGSRLKRCLSVSEAQETIDASSLTTKLRGSCDLATSKCFDPLTASERLQARRLFNEQQSVAVVRALQDVIAHTEETSDRRTELLLSNLDERLKRVDIKLQLDSIQRLDLLRGELASRIDAHEMKLEQLESRRNFTREVMEKQVAHQIEAVNAKLLEMEGKLIKYGFSILATGALVGTGLLRIVFM